MKKAIYLILIILAVSQLHAFAQPQRLVVLNMGTVAATEDGLVSLAAFCTDLARPAPGLEKDPTIYFGGDNTMVRYSENGILQDAVSLNDAKKNNKVLVQIERFKVKILPGNSNIKIVDVTTSGFGAGTEADAGLLNGEIMSIMPEYSSNAGRKVWEVLEQKIIVNKDLYKKQVEEYLKHHLTNENAAELKGAKVNENGKIILYSNNKDGNPGFGFLKGRKSAADLLYEAELQEGGICVEITSDGKVVLKISGKFRGIMPIEIEFSSEKKIVVTAQVLHANAKSIKKGGSYNVDLKVHFETSNERNENECKIKPSLIICYPPDKSTINFNVCGTDISAGLKGIEINF